MKNYLQLLIMPAMVASLSLTACSDDVKEAVETTVKETTLSAAASNYIDNVVLPTYKSMADAAINLYDYCVVMQDKNNSGTLTTADIENAANAWKTSRKYWELSEAFLFGPASDYNIDPHIDSWPLDKDAMDRLLTEIRNGADYSLDNNFGYGLLGFHSIEYMLYELSADGNTSSIHSTNYTVEEMKYLVMVAEDLRNQCVCLEACWAGTENLSEEKQQILEDADLDKGKNYGWMMKNAGKAGSIYKTYQETAEEILQGCVDIADEVGNTKIGRPHQGSTLDDRNYIESPYSLNSIEDFVDNIKSIQNSYCGVNSTDISVSTYVKSVNPDLDQRVRTAIDDAITAISAIPEPFAKNASGAAAGNAVTVVGTDLVNVLEEAYQQVLK
jgi:predicted lipoprotein